MYLILVLCVWITFGLIFVRWNRWRDYYPTILFYCVINLLYDFLYYNHTLWEFKAVTTDKINHTIISIAFFFIVIPVAVMIFLDKFPQKRKQQILYILAWSLFFWFIELLFYLKGMFVYYNGWTIWHSAWFDVLMFTIFRIHFVKPILALIITTISIIMFIVLFPISFASLK